MSYYSTAADILDDLDTVIHPFRCPKRPWGVIIAHDDNVPSRRHLDYARTCAHW